MTHYLRCNVSPQLTIVNHIKYVQNDCLTVAKSPLHLLFGICNFRCNRKLCLVISALRSRAAHCSDSMESAPYTCTYTLTVRLAMGLVSSIDYKWHSGTLSDKNVNYQYEKPSISVYLLKQLYWITHRNVALLLYADQHLRRTTK